MAKIINQSNLTCTFNFPNSTTQTLTFNSNQSMTENMTSSFVKTRESAKTSALAGQEIMQTLTLTNTTEYFIDEVNVQEISTGLTFKDGSVVIQNVEYAHLSMTDGFTLEDSIAPNETITIKFVLIVNGSQTNATSKTKISYLVNESDVMTEETNEISIKIVSNQLEMVKMADKKIAMKGDTIKYTITLENLGNVKNKELVFTDNLPAEVKFVENSVSIDGQLKEGFDPTNGFEVGEIDEGQKVVITFETIVV